MTVKRILPTVVDATALKMSLGSIGERVRTQDLQINKRGTPQAIVISVDRYQQLTRLEPIDPSSLDALQKEFDETLARMQSAQQAAAMNRLMDADEEDINRFLAEHYDRKAASGLAESSETIASVTQQTSRSMPVTSMTISTGSSILDKSPVAARILTRDSGPSMSVQVVVGALRHDKSGRILSASNVAAKTNKRKKPSK